MEKTSIRQSSIVNLFESDYYKIITTVIEQMNTAGLLDRGRGYCLSMSDMIQKLLYQSGIESELVECTLMIIIKNPPSLQLIGYEGMSNNTNYSERMDNHVVCVTKTPIPLLIDISLKNIDPQVNYVCIPIFGDESHTNFAEYNFDNSTWTYQKKYNSQLPVLHQESILKRITKDKQIDNKIGLLTKIVILFGIISTLNFTRGIYDFYLSFVLPNSQVEIKK
jgi:hypothetical protein